MKQISLTICALLIALSVGTANAGMADYTCRIKHPVTDVTKKVNLQYSHEIDGYIRTTISDNGNEIVHQYPNAQVFDGKLVMTRPDTHTMGDGIFMVIEVLDLDTMDIRLLAVSIAQPKPITYDGFCIER